MSSRFARLPPEAVTSHTAPASESPLATVTVTWPMLALPAVTVKSAAVTLSTASENVTRHFRVSALVRSPAGVLLRLIDVTAGASGS